MVLKHTSFRLEFADEDENGDVEPVKIIDLGVGYIVYAAIMA